MRCRSILPFAVVAAVLAASHVRAADPEPADDDPREAAYPLAPVADEPPELTPAPRAELMQARRLRDAGRHAEAAQLLEDLFAEAGDVRLLYHAAVARGRAGQHLRAVQLLDQFTARAGALSIAVQAHIDAARAAETAHLALVAIDLRERLPGGERPVPRAHEARVVVESDRAPATTHRPGDPLRLDPGSYRVRVELSGYTPATHAVDLVAGAYTIPLFVDPEPATLVVREPAPVVAPTRLHKDRRLVLGVGASMGVLFYGGIGVLLGGQRIESRAEERQTDLLAELGADPERPDAASLAALERRYPTAELHARLRRASDLQTAGTTVGMIGAGMIFGMLPNILEARPRAVYTVLGLGGVAIVGGSAWMADYRRRQDDILGRTDLAHRTTDDGLTGHRIGASMLVGLGVGMVVTSTATLLVDRARRRRPLAAVPLAAPGLAGLLVRGAF